MIMCHACTYFRNFFTMKIIMIINLYDHCNVVPLYMIMCPICIEYFVSIVYVKCILYMLAFVEPS